MLSLLLLTAALQVAPEPRAPPAEPNATVRILGSQPPGCDDPVRRAADTIRPGAGLA